MSQERFVLILAGGSGARFWPLSRDTRPKQLLHLFDEETLVEKTIQRLEGLVPIENILILTNAKQEEEMRKAAAMLPAENILAEPAKRDTAPAVALGIGWIARRNPEATMAVLPSDHLIQDAAGFRQVLAQAMDSAEKTKHLVTIGIKPTWPCPSYGYIERGALLENSESIFRVERFREKPSPDLAEEFLRQGTFSWNAGMFIWSIPAAVDELNVHCPELADFVAVIQKTEDFPGSLAAEFAKTPKTSIDYALMEKSERILNIEGTFDWDDVGNWDAVSKYLSGDEDDNRTRATLTKIDASENIVFSDTTQHVGLLGVKDLIIVQTKDALLVADRKSADQIKHLVDQLPENLR